MTARGRMSATDWSELSVTLLSADVEGSTRLWETEPEEMGDPDRTATDGHHRG